MSDTTQTPRSRRRLDLASLTLLLVGLIFGALSYWRIEYHGLNVLVIVPSVVAATTGATHLTKREAPRQQDRQGVRTP
ncbi:hypothetical protein [Nocardioides pakistanensis]